MNRYDKKYNKFYCSKEWKALRTEKFVEAKGLCEECKKKGKVVAGEEVHHTIPIEEDWSKRLDYDNLILLCKSCHNAVHNRESSLSKFLREWED